jgi:hypothetical protein
MKPRYKTIPPLGFTKLIKQFRKNNEGLATLILCLGTCIAKKERKKTKV